MLPQEFRKDLKMPTSLDRRRLDDFDGNLSAFVVPTIGTAQPHPFGCSLRSIMRAPWKCRVSFAWRDGSGYFAVTYSISPASGTRPAVAPSFSNRDIASRPRGP